MTRAAHADLSWRHPAGSTLVFLGEGANERAAPWLDHWSAGRQIFLVTTPRVEELMLPDWRQLLAGCADLIVLRVEEGEGAKSLGTAAEIWSRMLEAAGRRDSRMIGLGGGSVGDLAGFVAATFLRGIEVVLAPTTLLAQVDASIGGKTAIDLPAAKNSVGAFHHPAAVIADVASLASLPRDELRSGLIEVIKIGAADDVALFERIERDLEFLLEERQGLGTLVRDSVAAKIRVVEGDPGERGSRRLLNLGHTLGHAIESVLEYRHLRHGEAVAYGLLFAARLARLRGGEEEWLARLFDLMARLDLPVLPPLDIEELLEAIGRDKKARRDGVVWVLPTAPGRVEMAREIDASVVRDELARFLEHPLGRT